MGEETQYFDIVIHPLMGNNGLLAATHISFADVTVATQLKAEVKRVREDLETAYEELQSTNEELETTNEELQSSIEELETTNEELQSTNEELETTNEELQSGNEELETMNEELRIRTEELDEARAFLEGVVVSIAAGWWSSTRACGSRAGTGARPSCGAAHGRGAQQAVLRARIRAAHREAAGLRPAVPGIRAADVSLRRAGREPHRQDDLLQRDLLPFDGHNGGIVLLMEDCRTDDAA
ncbi:hypothetical protein NKH77_31750 [Streptomyces sp. M19]